MAFDPMVTPPPGLGAPTGPGYQRPRSAGAGSVICGVRTVGIAPTGAQPNHPSSPYDLNSRMLVAREDTAPTAAAAAPCTWAMSLVAWLATAWELRIAASA